MHTALLQEPRGAARGTTPAWWAAPVPGHVRCNWTTWIQYAEGSPTGPSPMMCLRGLRYIFDAPTLTAFLLLMSFG